MYIARLEFFIEFTLKATVFYLYELLLQNMFQGKVVDKKLEVYQSTQSTALKNI